MVNFAAPGALGSLSDFKRTFERPIVAGRDGDATTAEKDCAAERSAELSKCLSAFVLRRTSSVMDALLPPKTEAIIFCRLSPLQCLLYEAVVSRAVRGYDAHSSAHILVALNMLRQICGHVDLALESLSGELPSVPSGRSEMQQPRALAGKRRRTPSPTAVDTGYPDNSSDEKCSDAGSDSGGGDYSAEMRGGVGDQLGLISDGESEALEAVEDAAGDPDCVSACSWAPWARDPAVLLRSIGTTATAGSEGLSVPALLRALLPTGFTTLASAMSSSSSADSSEAITKALGHGSKVDFLDRLLQGVRSSAPQDRCVVVSNFSRMLDLVQTLCDARGWKSCRLDGSTPSDQRTALVARFNARDSASPFIFLLSAQAGGAGINLIGANRLVLMQVMTCLLVCIPLVYFKIHVLAPSAGTRPGILPLTHRHLRGCGEVSVAC